MGRRRKTVRFYTDEQGRVRPITRGNVAKALAAGIKIRRVVRDRPLVSPSESTVERYKVLVEDGWRYDSRSGLMIEGRGAVALVRDVEAMRNSPTSVFRQLAGLPEEGRTAAKYGRIYISKVKKDDWYRVGQSTLKGRSLKIALRTLGYRNPMAYQTGEDQPVMLVNELGEVVVMAPAIGVEERARSLPTP